MQRLLLPRLPIAGLIAWLALGLPSAPADAHSIVIASDPAANTVLHGTSLPVELHFNSRIDHERSRLTLIRPDASAVILPLAPESGPDVLATRIDGLVPGPYRLRWQVLGIDGHITRGDIPFQVAP